MNSTIGDDIIFLKYFQKYYVISLKFDNDKIMWTFIGDSGQ